MDNENTTEEAFKPVVYTSGSFQFLKFYIPGQEEPEQFNNGVYVCDTPEKAEKLDALMNDPKSTFCQTVRRIDREAALETARQNLANNSRLSQANQGPFTTQSISRGHEAVGQAKLQSDGLSSGTDVADAAAGLSGLAALAASQK